MAKSISKMLTIYRFFGNKTPHFHKPCSTNRVLTQHV